MNKSFITNGLSFVLVVVGYFLQSNLILTVGLFALSGALTNWIAIHMLFEKVPFLYGSGVMPAHFEDFKKGINSLIMEQFFTEENIDRFLSDTNGPQNHFKLSPVIEKVDITPAFEALVSAIKGSSFGGMLGMFGGEEALKPMKDPFINHMKAALIEITEKDEFLELLKDEMEQPDVMKDIRQKIEHIVYQRLEELTPQMVKKIIQDMIQEHLGWLVIWGGFFGGLIGLAAALLKL